MTDFQPKEETKLKLLAVLKEADKPLKIVEWAQQAGVNRKTIDRYLPLIKQEGWLNEKFGPSRSILYSVKTTKYVPPVGAIEAGVRGSKPDTLKMPKGDAVDLLYRIMMDNTEQPKISGSMLMYPLLVKASVILHLEVARALSGEMVVKANLEEARELITKKKAALENMLKFVNTLLSTPELWDVRSVHKFLAGDKPYDQIQLAMWTRDADDNADALLEVLQRVQDGSLFELLANQTEE